MGVEIFVIAFPVELAFIFTNLKRPIPTYYSGNDTIEFIGT